MARMSIDNFEISVFELAVVRSECRVEDSHWPSDIRKWLLLDPDGFPNLGSPRHLFFCTDPFARILDCKNDAGGA